MTDPVSPGSRDFVRRTFLKFMAAGAAGAAIAPALGGAGTALFASLCMGLKDMGAEYMTLFTGENNPARNIYRAAGFKIVRTWANMRREL